jgi:AcrR family transcriptional regulator
VAKTAARQMTKSDPASTKRASEQATRRAVIDAAVACILERGFYRASSNEIARRAGVTWGVIQHHFGTREALMLAVLEDGALHFTETLAAASIDAATTAGRIEQLLDILARHYGEPQYLAYLQVALNMDHDPETSAEVRATMVAVAERSTERLRTLVRDALGPATSQPDLAATVFLVLRGFVVSQQLLEVMSYDTTVPESDRISRQRRLVGRLLAPLIEQLADKAG